MKTKEMKEIIKSEIRVYMRMLKDMKKAMIERISAHKLRQIAEYYEVSPTVIDRLTKHEIIIGLHLEIDFAQNELYKGRADQENKEFKFAFTCQLTYKLADALRMYAIFDRHVDDYSKRVQAGVLRELLQEDSNMEARCEHCEKPVGKNEHYCSILCQEADLKEKQFELLAHKTVQESKKSLNWFERLSQWFRGLRKNPNPNLF